MSIGADILDKAKAALADYCILPSTEAVDAITLWIAMTHASAAFDFAPRLVVKSVEKRSGKTRVLEVVDGMSHDPIRLVNASISYLFRRVELAGDQPPTLLLDEADTLFGSPRQAERNEDLRGLLNSGFQRGTLYGRVEGPSLKPREYRTFAMAALAGIGDLPDTIEDRAIVVRIKRRGPGEHAMPFRSRNDGGRLQQIRSELAAWLEGSIDDLAALRPDLPVVDRAADVWEPLCAIAAYAGGQWPRQAWQASKFLTSAQYDSAVDSSFSAQLLNDVRIVFRQLGEPKALPTAIIIERLGALDEAPWRTLNGTGLDPRILSRRLTPYGVRPVSVRIGTEVVRGYRHADLKDAWDRYLEPASQGDTAATSATHQPLPVALVTA
ncbi:DUF3631 domain-containing protein [Agromyces sp. NPDC058104]|uniref:DUF3631 domain-containing protein n=1 Tax=Agromyces sp. NPDC058104 TaxID=3346342 RepID=UPI0036DF9C05